MNSGSSGRVAAVSSSYFCSAAITPDSAESAKVGDQSQHLGNILQPSPESGWERYLLSPLPSRGGEVVKFRASAATAGRKAGTTR